MRVLTVTAPAKVNLYLGVGPLRPDGYHAVTTVLHTLDLADTVRLMPADELSVTTSVDLGIPEEENLAFRAALAFAEEYGDPVRAVIEIEKHVPAQAGLGGGSSDAAAVLVGLARMRGVPLDDGRLVRVARRLGADCPFLLVGGCAVMRGRGDEYARKLPVLSADIALVKPAAAVSTAAAYRAFDDSPQQAGDIRLVTDATCFRDLPAVGKALSNSLTPVSSALVPEVAQALAWVREQPGIFGAEMAGSGSAVFAICADATHAQRVAQAAQARGWWAAATRTGAHGAKVTDEEGCS